MDIILSLRGSRDVIPMEAASRKPGRRSTARALAGFARSTRRWEHSTAALSHGDRKRNIPTRVR